MFVSTPKAPGLDSTEPGRHGPAWHGRTEGPANMSSHEAPGLRGVWDQQGLLLKATNPAGLPQHSGWLCHSVITHHHSLSPWLFPPMNFPLNFTEFSSSLEDAISWIASSQSLCIVRQELLGGKGNVPHFNYSAAAQKQEKATRLGQAGSLLTASLLLCVSCAACTKLVQQASEIRSAWEYYTEFNLQDKSQLHYLYL